MQSMRGIHFSSFFLFVSLKKKKKKVRNDTKNERKEIYRTVSSKDSRTNLRLSFNLISKSTSRWPFGSSKKLSKKFAFRVFFFIFLVFHISIFHTLTFEQSARQSSTWKAFTKGDDRWWYISEVINKRIERKM